MDPQVFSMIALRGIRSILGSFGVFLVWASFYVPQMGLTAAILILTASVMFYAEKN